VKSALGSGRLAERDLLEDMRSGRLATAARRTARDGAETFERLKPSFWKELTLLAPSDGLPVQVRGLDVKSLARSSLWFFVARCDLDKLYAGAAAAHQESDMPPPRRKPGKQPTYDWPLVVAAELIRRAKVGEKEPTAAKMIEFCEAKVRYTPGLKEMQLLLRKLRLG
jgi:hypothetical protein